MKQLLKSDLAIALAINIFFLVLCIIFGELRFGVMDDYFMAAILSGAHGTDYNVHMYFVNALYGYALLPLYHLFPKIGWYYIGEMFSVFLSFSVITYILLQKTGKQWGTILSTILIAFFASDFYLAVQFTQCAAILSAAGFLAFIWGITEKRSGIVALGCFMVLWGSILRWPAFFMGLPFLGVAALIQYKDCITNYKRILIFGLITSAAIYGAKVFDQSLYNTPEYKPYKEIQGPRAALGDGHDYDVNAVIADLKMDGKSVEDYAMLTQWKFYDTEVFCADSMRMFANYTYRHKNKFPANEIPSKLLALLSSSAGHYLCWIFFVFGIIILATNPKRGLYPWAALAVTLAMLGYLLSINRVVTRVENGFWIYASLLAIPQFSNLPKFNRQKIATILILAIVAVGSAYNISQIPPQVKKQDAYNQAFKFVDEYPDTMFIMSMPQYAEFARHKLPPYLAEPIGGFRRTISFGFWTPYLPDITEALKEFGITNPLKEIINDNVIVVGDKSLDEFLQRHYYDSVKVENIQSFDNIHFYKYSVIDMDKNIDASMEDTAIIDSVEAQ
ncbi:MAG: hypothetical protein MJY98_04645 [Fibrobacter sp.]|nr:hypothetical protein [Fibrobacter sp.]